MATTFKAPAQNLFGKQMKVPLETYGLQPTGTVKPWTVLQSTSNDVELIGPTGVSTPTNLKLHLNQIADWYSGKKWIDASAVPPVRSATRMNATYSETIIASTTDSDMGDKLLPVQVSLNVTVPNVSELADSQLREILMRATGAIFGTWYSAENSNLALTYDNVEHRIQGVLKPMQFKD